MAKAYGGALYGLDLLAFGALNRSKAHIAGFRSLLRERNLLCAGALLRLQIDTALRFFAASLVESPHGFAIDVLSGKQIRDIRDRSGKRLTDAYLVSRLGEEYEWIPRVYERTSGYVHFSATHIMAALSPTEDPADSTGIEMKISAIDKPLPESLYIEACDAFCSSTEVLLEYVRAWVFTKANPEQVAKWRDAGLRERFFPDVSQSGSNQSST